MFTLYDGLAGGGWLWQHVGATLKIVLYGFVFAVVLGVPLGVGLGRHPPRAPNVAGSHRGDVRRP